MTLLFELNENVFEILVALFGCIVKPNTFSITSANNIIFIKTIIDYINIYVLLIKQIQISI